MELQVLSSCGVNKTLTMNVSSGYGFRNYTTYLSGLNATKVLFVSFLFGVLLQGGSYIQSALQIPQSAADVLQGMLLLCALGSEFFVQYKVRFSKKNSVSSEVK